MQTFDCGAVQRSALCRSRRELSNEYLLAKLGVDTAENEPAAADVPDLLESPASHPVGVRFYDVSLGIPSLGFCF